MKVVIRKNELSRAIEFMHELELDAKQSRQRSKFIDALSKQLRELAEDEKELLIKYAGADKDGEPNKNADGSYAVNDVRKFMNDQKDLLEEEVYIEDGPNKDMLKTIKNVLDNYDGKLSSQKAAIYNILCEKFEEAKV